MYLKSLSFIEFEGTSRQWELIKFELNAINLIVGKNSSGKSRTLNVIGNFSNIILDPTLAYSNGYFKAEFEDMGSQISYELKLYDKGVVKEVLIIDEKKVLSRNSTSGKIFNVQVDKSLNFEFPKNTVAVTRRDNISYPFLEKLYNWALNVRYFHFNTDLGKTHFNASSKIDVMHPYNLRETNRAIDLFLEGNAKFSKKFTDAIIIDFNSIGYNITGIKATPQKDIKINLIGSDKLENVILGISVQEADLKTITDQYAMSTGMFRALAIIIHINYYELSQKPGTILIDDIGEGLDYDRSQLLINLLIEKANKTNLQLIMSTNDRFVMNNTPLEYWQIIDRESGTVSIYNHINSPTNFKDFEFTGLNNFDFFTTNFFKEGFSKVVDCE